MAFYKLDNTNYYQYINYGQRNLALVVAQMRNQHD
jgi:hypothetical protein